MIPDLNCFGAMPPYRRDGTRNSDAGLFWVAGVFVVCSAAMLAFFMWRILT
jgi:hypothetical protein